MNNLFEPLNEDEMEWLEQFLLDRIDDDEDCDGKDEGIFNISELDGLFTAVVSGPVTVPPSQWLPAIWGDFDPILENEKELEGVLSLFMRHMNSIASVLMGSVEDFEPMFYQRVVKGETYTIVDEWCEGYMRGVELAAGLWDRESIEMKVLLAPIWAFTEASDFHAHDHCDQQEMKNLQKAIAPNVREIHSYWLERRADYAHAGTVMRSEPKVGRNAPCPCGSGKKFKKCCLH